MITSTSTRIAAIGSMIRPMRPSIAAAQDRRYARSDPWVCSSRMPSAIAMRAPILRELVRVFFERVPSRRTELGFPAVVVPRLGQLLLEAGLVDVVEEHSAPDQLVAHRAVEVHVVVARLERRDAHLVRDDSLDVFGELVPDVLIEERPVARPDV